MRGARIAKFVGWVVLGILGATALALVLGLAVQALWNWLMPEIFNLPKITYWQTVGILVLAHILFKSHGHDRDHDHPDHRGRKIRDTFRRKIHGFLDGNGEKEREEKPEPA